MAKYKVKTPDGRLWFYMLPKEREIDISGLGLWIFPQDFSDHLNPRLYFGHWYSRETEIKRRQAWAMEHKVILG